VHYISGVNAISVVVVTYESAACIATCLASVREALPGAQLVVVDNGSRDDTLSVLQATAPQAEVIELGQNVGFGRACNAGVESAKGTHVLFLNPDAVVSAVDHPRLRQLLEERPFGLVAPVLEEEEDRRMQEGSWHMEYLSYTLGTLRPRELRPVRHSLNADKATWVSGAMLLVLRDEFLRQGGFDPRFFLYYEDRDLSYRYRSAGLPIRVTDSLRGRHSGLGSSVSNSLRTGPLAWALLGWIQYVWIHEGERKAGRAARATLTTLRAMHFGMQALAATRWPRAQRKARQIEELLGLVAARAHDDGHGFCPDAIRLIRALQP
jgi:N-acetylglucosaminyl-diphospho-decaprenol L-rhamnosyltransferase